MASAPEQRPSPGAPVRTAADGSDGVRRRWPWQRWAATVLVGCAAWAAAIWLAMHLMADMTLHHVALFAHVAALIVGFGGVLSTDFQAVMWLMGRRSLADVIRFGGATHALIWIGLTGLVVSGSLLNPDFSQPLTRVKMALVLVVILNGLGALALHHRLGMGTRALSRRLLVRATALGMISQLAWWGAIFIGFMSTNSPPPSQGRPASVRPSGPGGADPAATATPGRGRTGSTAGRPDVHKSATAKRHKRNRPGSGQTRRPSATPGPMGP